jgi:hypothetical protein
MWDDYHHKKSRPPFVRLMKEAGIPTAWMNEVEHRPTSRDDFISKMRNDYYTNLDAAGGSDLLPNCVGLAMTVQIRSGLHAKFRKEVTDDGVLSAIYCVCPEMLFGGIQPSQAIEMCNASHGGRGLLIPGATSNSVYFVKLEQTVFRHEEFGKAFAAAQQAEKLGCPPLAVKVIPSQKPPTHAMVAVGAGFLPGNRAAISAVDIQGPNEADITIDDFHQLIVCDITASELVGRGSPSDLSAEARVQGNFDSALESSKKVKKPTRPYSCSLPACLQPQKSPPALQDTVQDSIDHVQRSFEARRDNFCQMFKACDEVLQAHNEVAARMSKLVSLASRQEAPAPSPAPAPVQAQELACEEDVVVQVRDTVVAGSRNLFSSLAGQVEARGSLSSEDLKQMAEEPRRRLVENLDEIVRKFGFDEETQQVFSAGADDFLKSLERRRRCR